MDTIELLPRHGAASYEAVVQEEEGVSANSSLALNEIPPVNKRGSHSTSASLNNSDSMTRSRRSEHRSSNQIKHLHPKRRTKSDKPDGGSLCCLAFICIIAILIPIILLFVIFMPTRNPAESIDGLYTTFCTNLELNSTFIGPVQDILNIDIAFGNMSFSQARFIDIIWEIAVSRGGQIFLGWITYHVHGAAVLTIMETERVSYDYFTKISFSWPNLWHLGGLWMMMLRLGEKRMWLLGWVMVSTLWVSFWPALTNALTGYVASKRTMVKVLNGEGFLSYETIANAETLAFQYVNLSVPELGRVGGFESIGDVITKSGANISIWDSLNSIVQNKSAVNYGTKQSWLRTGFDVGNNTAAVPIFYYSNQSYIYDYFQNATYIQCTVGDSYQWGFSFGALFWFIILNGLWILCTYILWACLIWKSSLVRDRGGGGVGVYRAALDVAEMMREDLGSDLGMYGNEELERQLKKLPGVRYAVEDSDRGDGYIRLTSRKGDERVGLP